MEGFPSHSTLITKHPVTLLFLLVYLLLKAWEPFRMLKGDTYRWVALGHSVKLTAVPSCLWQFYPQGDFLLRCPDAVSSKWSTASPFTARQTMNCTHPAQTAPEPVTRSKEMGLPC